MLVKVGGTLRSHISSGGVQSGLLLIPCFGMIATAADRIDRVRRI